MHQAPRQYPLFRKLLLSLYDEASMDEEPLKTGIQPPEELLQSRQIDAPLESPVRTSAVQPSHPVLTEDHLRKPRRRIALPVLLFVLTCASTFWAGATGWQLGGVMLPTPLSFFHFLEAGAKNGLIYMGCLLGILFAHEMGHFIATVWHRVPASLPFFIPFPLSPFGTMGAVIGMDGRRADRKQIFDIGIAGPLAGLVVAIPVLILGVSKLDFKDHYGTELYDNPLIVDWLIAIFHNGKAVDAIARSELNPYFMAGWVGLLITGLNMMPVSQLDGGHVTYTLFGRYAHIFARVFIVVAIVFVVFSDSTWSVMLLLVILIGTDHPPTRDDSVPIGPIRMIIGYSSLLIPLLCFPTRGVIF